MPKKRLKNLNSPLLSNQLGKSIYLFCNYPLIPLGSISSRFYLIKRAILPLRENSAELLGHPHKYSQLFKGNFESSLLRLIQIFNRYSQKYTNNSACVCMCVMCVYSPKEYTPKCLWNSSLVMELGISGSLWHGTSVLRLCIYRFNDKQT